MVLIDGKLPGVSVYERNIKKMQEKVRWLESEIESKELKFENECTFKPEIISSSGQLDISPRNLKNDDVYLRQSQWLNSKNLSKSYTRLSLSLSELRRTKMELQSKKEE